jgi:ribosomal protein L27
MLSRSQVIPTSVVAWILLVLAALVAPSAMARADGEPSEIRTAKERLGVKASDEQRVDNCKVPIELRGAKLRPDECGDGASTTMIVNCGPSTAQPVAVFNFELIDTSLEGAVRGARADEQERLARMSDQLRESLRDSCRFSLVDLTPIASEALASNLQACGGCDMRLARRIGAELAITGTVQKVSNLILNMNIYVRDASTGATIAAMSADMRGNTDESWSRTLDWLIRNRLLAPGYGLQR